MTHRLPDRACLRLRRPQTQKWAPRKPERKSACTVLPSARSHWCTRMRVRPRARLARRR